MYIAILYNCIYFLYFNKDILNPQTCFLRTIEAEQYRHHQKEHVKKCH